jgi:chloride channel 3/4/5
MRTDLHTLEAKGLTLAQLEAHLDNTYVNGFPIVADRDSRMLVGHIGRKELRHAIGASAPFSPAFALF